MSSASSHRRSGRWRARGAEGPDGDRDGPDQTVPDSVDPVPGGPRSEERRVVLSPRKGRNYDPANYPAPIPKSQDFLFGTPKWKAPSIPRNFELAVGLTVDAYITDGTFGRCFSVTAASDNKDFASTKESLVAKVMRPVAQHNQYIGDAKIEAAYLSKLMADEQCPNSVVKFYGSVILPDPLNKQRCFHALIFEACDASLHAFWQDHARRRNWHPDDIQSIARQVLQCCAFLHERGFVHTDIKHKNMMLKNAALQDGSARPADNQVRVIDFGNMTHADDYHTYPIGTRQFRAPEIQLGLEWDEKFDLWGSGCVLHWMHESATVFEPHSEAEQLALMELVTGRPLPASLVSRSKKQHLFTGGRLRTDGKGGGKGKGDGKRKGGKKGDGKGSAARVVPIAQGVEDVGLQALLLDLFELDPADRPSAKALLAKHGSYLER